MSVQIVRDSRKSIDARLRALQVAEATPECAAAALQLMRDITEKRGRFLTELPFGRMYALFSQENVPALLDLYEKIRTTRDMSRGKPAKRLANQVAMRLIFDELVGDDFEPPKLSRQELPCSGCGWPAVTRCRRCQRSGCGLERCMPELPDAVELPYQICEHVGKSGDLLCSVRNDIDAPEIRDPLTSRPGPSLKLCDEWCRAGELGVDSGWAGIVPLGGGRPVKFMTPRGDGIYPIEVRAREGGQLQARVTFAEYSKDRSPSSLGAAGSFTGCFAICDPTVGRPGTYALLPEESDSVWSAGFGLLVRAARVEVAGIHCGRSFCQLQFTFSPTIRSDPRRR